MANRQTDRRALKVCMTNCVVQQVCRARLSEVARAMPVVVVVVVKAARQASGRGRPVRAGRTEWTRKSIDRGAALERATVGRRHTHKLTFAACCPCCRLSGCLGRAEGVMPRETCAPDAAATEPAPARLQRAAATEAASAARGGAIAAVINGSAAAAAAAAAAASTSSAQATSVAGWRQKQPQRSSSSTPVPRWGFVV